MKFKIFFIYKNKNKLIIKNKLKFFLKKYKKQNFNFIY